MLLVVADAEPPQVVCPNNISLEVVDASGATGATWQSPFATDNVGVQTFNGTAVSGSIFAFGATQVMWVKKTVEIQELK